MEQPILEVLFGNKKLDDMKYPEIQATVEDGTLSVAFPVPDYALFFYDGKKVFVFSPFSCFSLMLPGPPPSRLKSTFPSGGGFSSFPVSLKNNGWVKAEGLPASVGDITRPHPENLGIPFIRHGFLRGGRGRGHIVEMLLPGEPSGLRISPDGGLSFLAGDTLCSLPPKTASMLNSAYGCQVFLPLPDGNFNPVPSAFPGIPVLP